MIYNEIEDGKSVAKISVSFTTKDTDIIYEEKIFKELELAYALTIHKNQGSEFPVVLMPISQTQKSIQELKRLQYLSEKKR